MENNKTYLPLDQPIEGLSNATQKASNKYDLKTLMENSSIQNSSPEFLKILDNNLIIDDDDMIFQNSQQPDDFNEEELKRILAAFQSPLQTPQSNLPNQYELPQNANSGSQSTNIKIVKGKMYETEEPFFHDFDDILPPQPPAYDDHIETLPGTTHCPILPIDTLFPTDDMMYKNGSLIMQNGEKYILFNNVQIQEENENQETNAIQKQETPNQQNSFSQISPLNPQQIPNENANQIRNQLFIPAPQQYIPQQQNIPQQQYIPQQIQNLQIILPPQQDMPYYNNQPPQFPNLIQNPQFMASSAQNVPFYNGQQQLQSPQFAAPNFPYNNNYNNINEQQFPNSSYNSIPQQQNFSQMIDYPSLGPLQQQQPNFSQPKSMSAGQIPSYRNQQPSYRTQQQDRPPPPAPLINEQNPQAAEHQSQPKKVQKSILYDDSDLEPKKKSSKKKVAMPA